MSLYDKIFPGLTAAFAAEATSVGPEVETREWKALDEDYAHSNFDIRSMALNIAIGYLDGNAPIDKVIVAAKQFETYLKGEAQ